jgi:hypothetical protein
LSPTYYPGTWTVGKHDPDLAKWTRSKKTYQIFGVCS